MSKVKKPNTKEAIKKYETSKADIKADKASAKKLPKKKK